MSALPPKADIARRTGMSALCQKRDLRAAAKVSLLDDLVGEREELVGHCEAERLGSGEVDHEIKLGRLHDREVGRLLSLENSPGIDAALAIPINETCSVTH